MLRHELIDRWHAEEHVDAGCGIADQPQRLAGIEGAHDVDGAAGMQHGIGVAIQPAGVEQRQHREQHRSGRDISGAAEIDAVPERHAVGDDRALRQAGGARGVHDGRDVIERDVLECRDRLRRRNAGLVGTAGTELQRGADVAELRHRQRGLGEIVVVDHHDRRGIADDELQFGNGETIVERQEDRAEPEAGELHLQRIRRVERQHRDAVAARHLQCSRANGRQDARRAHRVRHRRSGGRWRDRSAPSCPDCGGRNGRSSHNSGRTWLPPKIPAIDRRR